MRSYGANTGDRPLINTVIRLHNFLDTLGQQESLRRSWKAQLQTMEQGVLEDLAVVRRQKGILQSQLNRVISRLEHAGG